MALFETLEGAVIAARIRNAGRRIMLCTPGFDDIVGTALIEAHRRLPEGSVDVIVDGSDQAARLGYGYFDAVKQVSDAGVPIRVEPGLRLGLLVVDEQGWTFTSPPLLVDATMEAAAAPNAMALTAQQVAEAVSALVRRPAPEGTSPTTSQPELGQRIATPAEIEKTHAALTVDPPQRFDVARKVTVFNAFVEFVEIELLGTQLGRQRVPIPPALLLAVSDKATRDRLTTSFQLIGDDTTLGKQAKELRRRIEEIRKEHTRAIGTFGSVGLRANRTRLEQAIEAFRKDVDAFREEARRRLEKEIDQSRRQLVDSVLPGIRKSPPETLLSSIVGKPTVDQLRRWIEQQLDRAFPPLDRLVTEMQVKIAFKGVTYETLNDPAFQAAVRKAYPLVDFDKPFKEFPAARGDSQPDLPGV
ncbi:MAG: hypothetical protein U1F58_07335 [Burkholderiales bacterium]